AGIEVPERSQWIRTMLAEWNRILNHLMFMGSYPLELGAITPIFYAFIERELIQGLMESATGGRMHFSFVRPGGLKDDLPHGWLKNSADVLKQVRAKLKDFDNLVMGNEIVFARTKGIGAIAPETAIGYGCSGPVLPGSGGAMDPRKGEPYAKYDEVEFDVPVGRNGDSYDRLWVLVQRMHESCAIIEQCMEKLQAGGPTPAGRHGDPYDRLWVLVQRMHESCAIIEQCMEKLPAGDYIAGKLPKKLSLEGETYVRTENPLGMMGYYVVGNGKKEPYRLKMRTPSFSNVSVLPAMLPGSLVPDLIALLGSIFFVVGDIDR